MPKAATQNLVKSWLLVDDSKMLRNFFQYLFRMIDPVKELGNTLRKS